LYCLAKQPTKKANIGFGSLSLYASSIENSVAQSPHRLIRSSCSQYNKLDR
jgi:hypothetical protein